MRETKPRGSVCLSLVSVSCVLSSRLRELLAQAQLRPEAREVRRLEHRVVAVQLLGGEAEGICAPKSAPQACTAVRPLVPLWRSRNTRRGFG